MYHFCNIGVHLKFIPTDSKAELDCFPYKTVRCEHGCVSRAISRKDKDFLQRNILPSWIQKGKSYKRFK